MREVRVIAARIQAFLLRLPDVPSGPSRYPSQRIDLHHRRRTSWPS